MNYKEIMDLPINTSQIEGEKSNIHESCFRSYQILEEVKKMLNRGDSTETVLKVIDFLEN